MTKFNVVFDGVLSDADIIAIPDVVAPIISTIQQEFLNWIFSADNNCCWVTLGGRKVVNIETDGFVEWLNSRYCNNTVKARIIEKNTSFCPEYETIEF